MSVTSARVAAVAAAALLVGPLALLSTGADALTPTRCDDTSSVSRVGDWESVRGPSFTTRPGGRGQTISAFAVHPGRSQVRFATNGTSVERTDDSGCTWREVWVLPDVPSEEDTLAVATAEVTELVVPLDSRASDRLVLLVRDTQGGPRVLVSVDGGREEPFRDRSEGLPPAGAPSDLMIAATNPDFFFVSVQAGDDDRPVAGTPLPLPTLPPLPPLPGGPTTVGPESTGALYGSVDAGLTWDLRLDVDDLGGSTTGIDLLAGHPTSPNRLWAVSDGILRSSTDGGRTFAGPGPSADEQRRRAWDVTAIVADAELTRAGTISGTAVVTAFSRTSAQGGGPIVLTSGDSGVTFDEARAPGVVDSVGAFLPGSGTFVGSTTGEQSDVHLYRVRGGRLVDVRDVGPPVQVATLAVTTDRSSAPTFHARAGSSLLRYVGPEAAVPPALPPVIGGVVRDGIAPLGAASLAPTRDVIQLGVGETRTVNHRLTPPRRLTPLDVYVLVDTSISMADDLARVQDELKDLVRRLKDRGLDLSVGLGEFKGGESTVAYRRVVGVGPDSDEFDRGLASLEADGFGLEAQLIAMEQALTGLGEGPGALVPAACKFGLDNPDRFVQQERRTAPLVTKGQEADFRRGAVPVVLVVTDTNFLRPAGTRLKPDCSVDVDAVAADYARAGVHVVGLGVDDIDNAPRAADLTTFARETGALQPPGPPCAPVIDSRQGAPAVCREAADLLPTLERLAGQQREPADLLVVESPESPVVAALPGRFSAVDLRRPQPLDLPVTYSCAGIEPDTYDAGIDVTLAGVTLASISATVTCLAGPVAALGPPLVAVAPPVVGVLPPPGAVPPPPPPAQVVQPQVQTQPQANPQVQGGTQEEQQQQVDLALALQSGRLDETTELAMSAREPAVPPALHLAVLTAMTVGAGGLAMRQQARERTSLRTAR